ncbi:MAG: SDR family oxidoreductase [Bacteroidetes bacterium]|nr:MAG: SDR family oxidoreductase [Bacteroidota bacterium]
MKTALITGFTSGIGKATVKSLLTEYEMILVCRNKEKGINTINEFLSYTPHAKLHLFVADLSSIKEVNALCSNIKAQFSKLDLLINNAGLFIPQKQLSADGYELTLATNHLSAFQLTNALVPILINAKESRIINVASEAHKIAKLDWNDMNLTNQFSGIRAYANSKLYNIMFTYKLAEQLKDSQVTVNAMHPGGVNTNFGKNVTGFTGFLFNQLGFLMRTPEKGAETIIWLATSNNIKGVTGKYFKDKKAISSLAASYNQDNLNKLWALSQEMINNILTS